MNLGTLLPRQARFRSHHTAVVFQETRLTRHSAAPRSCYRRRVESLDQSKGRGGYRRVGRVVVKEDFPRSTAGKTLKRVIREEFSGPGLI
jgi:hypothetical protein